MLMTLETLNMFGRRCQVSSETMFMTLNMFVALNSLVTRNRFE
jgi:hypothetical protein